MQKIMSNDKYGLTEAVLAKRKPTTHPEAQGNVLRCASVAAFVKRN